MAPTGNRFGGGPHGLTTFPHLTQQQLHHPNRLLPQTSAGLPPPSLGGHGFGNQPNFNPFAAPGGINAGLGSGYDPSQSLASGTGLGSREAKLGFAHGAALQQQQQQQVHNMPNDHRGLAKLRIREVWRHNMHQEMATLRRLIDDYPYVSMVR
jgi:CCR4-NOT transcription complex subunit 7/8